MNIDFFRLNKPFVLLSIAVTIATIVLLFNRGFTLGTEFTGGIEMRADFPEEITADTLAKKINSNPSLSITVETITSSDANTFVIRNALIEDDAIKTEEAIVNQLQEVFPDEVEITQTTLIGGIVGKENSINAIILSFVVVIIIILYLSLRFKFMYGLSAAFAVMHDVMIMLFAVLLFNMEMNVLVIVALLTIFGYSVNDSIIFFDRIRDEARHYHSVDYRKLLTLSLNNVFVRTLITSITTFVVILALFLTTEGGYREFALLLMIGVITGSYSSIYVVGPIMLSWDKFIRKQL